MKSLVLLVLFSLFAVCLSNDVGISCWAYQDKNGEQGPHTITCPGEDVVCVRYRAADLGGLVTSTCVPTEGCATMLDNPQVYSEVKCCDVDNCNHPNSSGILAINFVALLALIGVLLL